MLGSFGREIVIVGLLRKLYSWSTNVKGGPVGSKGLRKDIGVRMTHWYQVRGERG